MGPGWFCKIKPKGKNMTSVVASMAFVADVADKWPSGSAYGFWLGTKLYEDCGKNPSLLIKRLAHVALFGKAIKDCFTCVRSAYKSDLQNGCWAFKSQNGDWGSCKIIDAGKPGIGSYFMINNITDLIDAGLVFTNAPEDSALRNVCGLLSRVSVLFWSWPLKGCKIKDRIKSTCFSIGLIARIILTVCYFQRLVKIPVAEKNIHILRAVILGAGFAHNVYEGYRQRKRILDNQRI